MPKKGRPPRGTCHPDRQVSPDSASAGGCRVFVHFVTHGPARQGPMPSGHPSLRCRLSFVACRRCRFGRKIEHERMPLVSPCSPEYKSFFAYCQPQQKQINASSGLLSSVNHTAELPFTPSFLPSFLSLSRTRRLAGSR